MKASARASALPQWLMAPSIIVMLAFVALPLLMTLSLSVQPFLPDGRIGDGWTGVPDPGSREELAVARRAAARLEEILGVELVAIHPATVDPPTRRRRWPWLTGLLLGRPRA